MVIIAFVSFALDWDLLWHYHGLKTWPSAVAAIIPLNKQAEEKMYWKDRKEKSAKKLGILSVLRAVLLFPKRFRMHKSISRIFHLKLLFCRVLLENALRINHAQDKKCDSNNELIWISTAFSRSAKRIPLTHSISVEWVANGRRK